MLSESHAVAKLFCKQGECRLGARQTSVRQSLSSILRTQPWGGGQDIMPEGTRSGSLPRGPLHLELS